MCRLRADCPTWDSNPVPWIHSQTFNHFETVKTQVGVLKTHAALGSGQTVQVPETLADETEFSPQQMGDHSAWHTE